MEYLDLSEFFTTKAQADDFSERLTLISERIFEVNFNMEKVFQEQLGMQKKDKFIALLRKNNIPIDSPFSLNKILEIIRKNISSLPIACITLSIEPQDEILKAISDWFILNIKRQVLIDIKIEPDLIAGALISYRGKQFDASIKAGFDKISKNILDKENHTEQYRQVN